MWRKSFLWPVFVDSKIVIINNSKLLLIMMPLIVGKKWDPGILDPSRFSAQIRKVEARLGKLAKIRKVETN